MALDAASLAQQGLTPERTRLETVRYRTWWFIKGWPLGAAGGLFVLLLVAMALFPGFFANHNPSAQTLPDRLNGMSWDHYFGMDQNGRDLFSRIMYGARTSIMIGFGITILGNSLDAAGGIVSGYFGGLFDLIYQRWVDIVIALPGLIFIILFVTTLRTRVGGDVPAIILSIALLNAMAGSRTIRGMTMSAKQNQYVDAARAIGAGHVRIMARHIFPNVFAIILVGMSLTVGGAVLLESSLSYLGYGVQPPTPSWGRMLSDARSYLVRAPHIAIFPGLLIFMTVYSFNMLGDALRDVLDPRMRGTK